MNTTVTLSSDGPVQGAAEVDEILSVCISVGVGMVLISHDKSFIGSEPESYVASSLEMEMFKIPPIAPVT